MKIVITINVGHGPPLQTILEADTVGGLLAAGKSTMRAFGEYLADASIRECRLLDPVGMASLDQLTRLADAAAEDAAHNDNGTFREDLSDFNNSGAI